MDERCCPVCVETYNKRTRRAVECPACMFKPCTACVCTYLLSTAQDPHCMNATCKRPWTSAFVAANTTLTFQNKLLDHRANILLQLEHGLLPETQAAAAQELEQRRVSDRITEIMRLRRTLKNELYQLRQRGWANRGGLQAVDKPLFVQHCMVDDCRGFLSNDWQCGVCQASTCKKCLIVKQPNQEQEHECNSSDIATASLIQHETRPCPSCGIRIHKVQGCDQMWCTQCNTPFDWKTGRVLHGVALHNPHMFEWLRRGGQQQPSAGGAVVNQHPARQPRTCDDVNIDVYSLHRRLRERATPPPLVVQVCDEYRRVWHVSDVELARYPLQVNPQVNRTLRVRYLLKELSEDKWKQTLKTQAKQHERDREVHLILDTYVNVGRELLRSVYSGELAAETMVEQAEQLKQFTRQALEEVRKRVHLTIQVLHWFKP